MKNLVLKTVTWAQVRRHRQEGQTFIEYALVVALVSIVLAVAIVAFGEEIIDAAQAAVDEFLAS